jgi:hypothetical protein
VIHRRSFLTGLGALIAAPSIVHAGNLMPVSSRAIMGVTNRDLWETQFIEEMVQRLSITLIYGNPETAPTQFMGFFTNFSQELAA